MYDEKDFKDLINYFAKHNHEKSIKMLILYYHELARKIEKYGEKIFDDCRYMLDRVLKRHWKI